MSVIDDMSIGPITVAVAAALCGFGLKTIQLRAKRLQELARAREHLARCHEALELLDSPETPEHVLELAKAFCDIMHDRRVPELLALASKLNPALARRSPPEAPEIEAEQALWRDTPAKSMQALMSVIYEGAEAMSLRWPEIAPAFARLRQLLAVAPADSTREIILIRDQARRYSDGGFATA